MRYRSIRSGSTSRRLGGRLRKLPANSNCGTWAGRSVRHIGAHRISMLKFLVRRLAVMALTMFVLSLIVFFFVNLEPNLKKLAITQTEMRASQQELDSWLQRNGYRDNFMVRYGRWIGVIKQQPVNDP